MMKVLQYLVLLLLIGNGLQPYLIDTGWITGSTTDIEFLGAEDCPTEESEDQDESTTDYVESQDSQVLEPKPNEFQLNSGLSTGATASTLVITAPIASDWAIGKDFLHTKIGADLKQHVYFSKRAIDDHA